MNPWTASSFTSPAWFPRAQHTAGSSTLLNTANSGTHPPRFILTNRERQAAMDRHLRTLKHRRCRNPYEIVYDIDDDLGFVEPVAQGIRKRNVKIEYDQVREDKKKQNLNETMVILGKRDTRSQTCGTKTVIIDSMKAQRHKYLSTGIIALEKVSLENTFAKTGFDVKTMYMPEDLKITVHFGTTPMNKRKPFEQKGRDILISDNRTNLFRHRVFHSYKLLDLPIKNQETSGPIFPTLFDASRFRPIAESNDNIVVSNTNPMPRQGLMPKQSELAKRQDMAKSKLEYEKQKMLQRERSRSESIKKHCERVNHNSWLLKNNPSTSKPLNVLDSPSSTCSSPPRLPKTVRTELQYDPFKPGITSDLPKIFETGFSKQHGKFALKRKCPETVVSNTYDEPASPTFSVMTEYAAIANCQKAKNICIEKRGNKYVPK